MSKKDKAVEKVIGEMTRDQRAEAFCNIQNQNSRPFFREGERIRITLTEEDKNYLLGKYSKK